MSADVLSNPVETGQIYPAAGLESSDFQTIRWAKVSVLEKHVVYMRMCYVYSDSEAEATSVNCDLGS